MKKQLKKRTQPKLIAIAIALAVVLVVGGLIARRLLFQIPSVNRLTEDVGGGVTITQTATQERRGTGTVTNSGGRPRQTQNISDYTNPNATAQPLSCTPAKETECTSKGQKCTKTVYGGVCQDIPGTTPAAPGTIVATGASCAGQWTSIGSGSWAQWGGTKDPTTGKDIDSQGSQVCMQCLNGVWQTKDASGKSLAKLCNDVPYIPRPDQVIEKTVAPSQYACFSGGTWYSSGSNTGSQTCSQGHWCATGQEWDGSACKPKTVVVTPPANTPSACTPGCEGNNLRTCGSHGSKHYQYCPGAVTGSVCDTTTLSCKSPVTPPVATSYSCGTGAGGTIVSISKTSSGQSYYNQCDNKGCGLNGKCIGATLGPADTRYPTTPVTPAAPAQPASPLTSTQQSQMTNPSLPWSVLNPIIVNSDKDCPAGSTVSPVTTITASGLKTTYKCTPHTTPPTPAQQAQAQVTNNTTIGGVTGFVAGATAGAIYGTITCAPLLVLIAPACGLVAGIVGGVIAGLGGAGIGSIIPVTNIPSVPAAPATTTTTLTSAQKSLLEHPELDWSVSNPIRTTNKVDCFGIGNISSDNGFPTTHYTCTP